MPKQVRPEVKRRILQKYDDLKNNPQTAELSQWKLCARASGKSGIPTETVKSWLKAQKKSAKTLKKSTSAQKVSDQLEKQIVACCLFFANIYRPLKPIEISWIAFQATEGRVFGGLFKAADFEEWSGRHHWGTNFIKRHKVHLKKNSGQALVEGRTDARIPLQVGDWLVKANEDLANQDPRFVYNGDESSITQFGKKQGQKFVFSRSDVRHNIVQKRFTNEGSYLPIVAANGDKVCSLWVLRENLNNYDAAKWLLPQEGDVPRYFVFNKTGKVTKPIFAQFLTYLDAVLLERINKLEPDWKRKGVRQKILLDNVSCHYVTLTWMELKEHGIDCVFLPKNTTHCLQPLDNVYFKEWRSHLSKRAGLATLLQEPGGDVQVHNSLVTFAQEAEQKITAETIKKSFANTGIYPFSPVKIGKIIHAVFHPGQPEAITDDQKEVEKLLKIMQQRLDTSALKENTKKRNADDRIEVDQNIIYSASDLLKLDTKRRKKEVDREKIAKAKKEAKTAKEKARAAKMEKTALAKLAKKGCCRCTKVIDTRLLKYMKKCEAHPKCQVKFCDECWSATGLARKARSFEQMHEKIGECPKIYMELEEENQDTTEKTPDECSDSEEEYIDEEE